MKIKISKSDKYEYLDTLIACFERTKGKDQAVYSKSSTNPTPFMYVLHNLQGQLFGIHDLIVFLNSAKVEHTLRFLGSIVFHTMGPKDLREFSPLYTLLTLGLANLSPILVVRPLLLWSNISFINGGDKLFFTLNISIATLWMFLWWTDMDLSFFKSSSNDDL